MSDDATTSPNRAPSRRGAENYNVPGPGLSIDGALVIGLVTAFSLITVAMVIGGSPRSFVDFPSLLIVFFGSFAVTTVSFSFSEVFSTLPLMVRTVFPPSRDHRVACERVMNLADIARRFGILAIEGVLPRLESEPFLQRAVAMAVDGANPDHIQDVLETEIESTGERLSRSINVLRRAAEVAPSMGLIGTLIGLIQMLANLNDPESIGPAMAIALLTTFYGAILAYMVFAPIAAKIERNAAEERLIQQIYMTGAASIARQENPRELETLLNTILPPHERLDYFT